MRLHRLVLLLAFVSVGAPALASSFVVVPNNRASTAGNGTDSVGPGAEPDTRFQELYGGGQFLPIGSPILIDQFAWRVAPGTGVFDATFANVDLYMSTSPRFPNLNGGASALMSETFADNVGPDNTLVYHGPVTMVSPGCAGPAPCPFDLVVTLQTPFFYDPLQGRLLLDFRVSGIFGVVHSFWDDDDYGGGFGSIASVGGPLGAIAGDFSASGDITQFRYTAVPEPATMTLLLTGLGAAAAARRRRVAR
ncbi:MAG TPA: PEP-CTERM sorting domain-containing protein [Vicinamibacterales bacterium]|nr:PEP-CTERM sorting domain-containing protein [Vicinamibacterales bacterium]